MGINMYLYIYIHFHFTHDLYPIILPRRRHRQVVFGGQLRGHLRSQRRVATSVEEVLLEEWGGNMGKTLIEPIRNGGTRWFSHETCEKIAIYPMKNVGKWGLATGK